MARVSALVFALAAACIAVLSGRNAQAAPPATQTTPVTVLSIWTDDVDDAADALTQALKAHVRASDGWSLSEQSQSFETLAIALRCPPKPDAACLQRIGDQLRVAHYVWGTAGKRKGGGIEAEVHVWNRGHAGTDASATLADSTKDANDPALRVAVAKIWDELTGAVPSATLVVHAGTGGGAVVVDGDERDVLRAGTARVAVAAGEHTVTVRVPGFRAAPQTASVAEHAERDVEFTLAPVTTAGVEAPAAPAAGKEGGLRAKSIAGYVAIAAGVGMFVAAGVEAANWFSDKNASDADRANVPNTVADVCAYGSPPAQDACQKGKNAKTVSALGWVFAGAGAVLGATGAWLVLSDTSPRDTSHESGARRPPPPRLQVVPEIGVRTQSISLRVTF